jgi:hypothetical protein
MTWWPRVRVVGGLALLGVGFYWIWHTKLDPNRANLYVTEAICVVTAVYALITFEILLQNQAMARAATDSTKVMQQTLRFSYAPNLVYQTLNTKDPTLGSVPSCTAVDNEDYQSAMGEFGEGGHQKEFVFAIVRNVGQGVATNLGIDATYNIRDKSSASANFSVNKRRPSSNRFCGFDNKRFLPRCPWSSSPENPC